MEYEADGCRQCGGTADGIAVKVSCQFCKTAIQSGQVEYVCSTCFHSWKVGARGVQLWNDLPVCKDCSSKEAGNCVTCDQIVSISDAVMIDGYIVCSRCWQKVENIWCPVCNTTVSNSGYLNFVFRQNPAALHAAALVTHYRHYHRKSYDQAWSNSRYRHAIPNYDYDSYKETVNNQAKRQLIRKILKLLKSEAYPANAPIPGRDLIIGFKFLKENDVSTVELIEKTLAKLDANRL